MLLKKLIFITMIISVLFISASCADQNKNEEKDSNDVSQGDGSITVYCHDTKTIDYSIQNAIEIFNAGEYGKVRPKVFEYNPNDIYELNRQLEIELAAGEGPDLIIICPDYQTHLLKLIQSGAFYDLNELMKDDAEFNPAEYNEKVLECAVVDGIRYFLPLSYNIDNLLYSTKQYLEDNQLSIDGRYISYEDLAGMFINFNQKHAGEEQYLVDGFSTDCMDSSTNLLDPGFTLNHTRTIKYLEQFKLISSSVFFKPGQMIIGTSMPDSGFSEGKVVFSRGSASGFPNLVNYYERINSKVDPEIFVITPESGTRTANIKPGRLVAINKNCANRKAAYEFIKILLSEEIQMYTYPFSFPINKAAYEDQKNAILLDPNWNFLYKTMPTAEKTYPNGIGNRESMEHMISQLDEIMAGDLSFNFLDTYASEIIYDENVAVYTGKKTPEEAAGSIQQNLTDYLNGDINDYVHATAPTPTPTSSQEKDMPVLTIQYTDIDNAVGNAIKAFNGKRQDVRIEGTEYPNSSRDEYINKLTTGIMAGEGPDIIYYDRYIFNSLYKTASTGVFCDLNELIANDDTFKNLDLNYRVLDAGVFDGKRYSIPLRYEFPLLMTTQGILSRNGSDINDSNWTIDEFKRMAMSYAKDSGNKYFIDSNFIFSLLVNGSRIDFVDYAAKTANFNSPEFIRLMEFYKDIHPHLSTYETESNSTPEGMLRNGTILMDCDFIQSPEKLWYSNSYYSEILGEEPLLYPIPSMINGGDIPVSTMYGVSVSQDCMNKQAALDFIEELLSEDIQKAKDKNGNINFSIGFPVNNKALRDELEYYKSASAVGMEISTGSRSYTSISMSESLASRITDLTGRACAGPEIDLEIYSIISEGLHSYLDGKRTAEQAAKDINNKVTLFLNE